MSDIKWFNEAILFADKISHNQNNDIQFTLFIEDRTQTN